MKKPVVGLVGCGSISQRYLDNAQKLYAEDFEIGALCDIRPEAARARAEQFGIGRVLTLEEMLNAPDIDLVLNLTVPGAHLGVTLQCLDAGKHVYTEKPFALTGEDAQKILDTAKRKGLRVGCAPDTFLGAPIQSALKAIESGYIGDVMGAHCLCIHPTHGNENWHPEPAQYYKPGAGPMFDMGPYYLNALITLIGPLKSVCCLATKNYEQRRIRTQPHRGEMIRVEIPTHVLGMFEFAGGAVGTFINSLDIWNSRQPWIEIYGTKGTLQLPDPDKFEGEVWISRLGYGNEAWEKLPVLTEYKHARRGEGIRDMLRAIRENSPIRCCGEMAAHVVDIVSAFDKSAATAQRVALKSTCERPLPRWIDRQREE